MARTGRPVVDAQVHTPPYAYVFERTDVVEGNRIVDTASEQTGNKGTVRQVGSLAAYGNGTDGAMVPGAVGDGNGLKLFKSIVKQWREQHVNN